MCPKPLGSELPLWYPCMTSKEAWHSSQASRPELQRNLVAPHVRELMLWTLFIQCGISDMVWRLQCFNYGVGSSSTDTPLARRPTHQPTWLQDSNRGISTVPEASAVLIRYMSGSVLKRYPRGTSANEPSPY